MSDTEKRSDHKSLFKFLHLYKILWEMTDGVHGLKMPEIQNELQKRGYSANRKVIYEYFDVLREFGVKIDAEEKNRYKHCILERTFNIMDLRLLADAVASSRFLTKEGAEELMEKLKTLCSKYDAETIGGYVYIANREISEKHRIYNLPLIHNAISNKLKIEFTYVDYDINKERKPREGTRVCSPFALTINEEKYYLIAGYMDRKDPTHFRVDRMDKIKILENEPADAPPSNFDLSKYMSSTFSMFGGEEEDVTLRFDTLLINAVIDRFGKSITLYPDGDSHFTIRVPIRTSNPAPFFSWLFQFGDKARILAPQTLREKYVEMLNRSAELYTTT